MSMLNLGIPLQITSAGGGGGGGGSKWYAPRTGAPTTLPLATGVNSLAAGSGAQALDSASIAFGLTAYSGQSRAISMGRSATASGIDSLAIGDGTTGSGTRSVALGKIPVASGSDSVALGHQASASATNAMALGRLSSALGVDSIAIGVSSVAAASGSGRGVAIGNAANAGGEDAIALGTSAASGQQGVAIGYAANSNGPSVSANVAVGSSAAVCDYGTSLGYGATCAGNYSRGNIAIGWGADARNTANAGAVPAYVTNATALGFSAIVHNEGEIASAIVFPGVTGTVGHARQLKVTADTTDATVTSMENNTFGVHAAAPNNAMLPRIPDNSCATFIAKVAAYQTGGAAGTVGDSAGWTITGVFKKVGAGAFALVGVPTVTAEGADAGTAWGVAVAANANGLQIQVTGEVNKNIHWVCVIDLANTV